MTWLLGAGIAWAVLLVILGVLIARQAAKADRADEVRRVGTARRLAAEWADRLTHGRASTAARTGEVPDAETAAERSTGNRGR